MPFIMQRSTFQRSQLPLKLTELQARLAPQLVNKKVSGVLLHPDSDSSIEPTFIRFIGMLRIGFADGSHVQGVGQMVVTGKRIIGVTDGTMDNATLNENGDSVTAFSLDWDDCGPIGVKKNWFGGINQIRFLPNDAQNAQFGVVVLLVAANIKNNGDAVPATIRNLLERLPAAKLQAMR